MSLGIIILALLCAAPVLCAAAEVESLRELGIRVGRHEPGPLNAITDLPGVLVGHCTLLRGESIRTGVTVILPHAGNLFLEKVEGAVETFNGFGKLIGSTQVNELGQLETPILLTNTLSVPRAADALLSWLLERPGMEEARSINPLVAETNDGYLNEIRARAVGEAEVRAALENARGGPVEQGSVGAGAGTRCLGFKGGIGSASRVAAIGGERYTVGVLAQTNFGGRLTVAGRVLGAQEPDREGSCILVVATDAPLGHRNLRRLARRAFAGMARTGADFSNGSGDYAIAFTTHPEFHHRHGQGPLLPSRRELSNEAAGGLFEPCAEAAEEAILNSLLHATAVTGREGHRVEALGAERLKALPARE